MAKCTSCSAPLPGFEPVCAYCGTRNSIDLEGRYDGTGVHESGRPCPGCGANLQTVDLRADPPLPIERCPECFGLFFDSGELEELLESSVRSVFAIEPERLEALCETNRAETVRYRKCPICGTFMNRVAFGSRSGVVVDRCKGHGTWLDAGELQRLLEWKRAGGQLFDQQVRAERQREEEERRRSEAPGNRGEEPAVGLLETLLG